MSQQITTISTYHSTASVLISYKFNQPKQVEDTAEAYFQKTNIRDSAG